MIVEITATNSNLPRMLSFLDRHKDTYRFWKISVNKHLKDYKVGSTVTVERLPGGFARFKMRRPKGEFFIAILISAFPSVGVKPYHGTIIIDGKKYSFQNVDAYHEAVIEVK